MHRSSAWHGWVYLDFSNHRWNRPFSRCDRRRPDVYRDCGAGIFRRLGHRPRHDHRNWGDNGNDLRDGRSRPIRGFRPGRRRCPDAGDMLIAGGGPAGTMLRIRSPARVHVVCRGRSGERITGDQQISRSSSQVPTCEGPQTPVANRVVSTDQVDGLSTLRSAGSGLVATRRLIATNAGDYALHGN